jgi:hypothetical protein
MIVEMLNITSDWFLETQPSQYHGMGGLVTLAKSV